MDVSIFLAKVIAIYYVLVSIALLCHPSSYKAIIVDLRENQPLMFVSGLIAIVVGALMVVAHNIWEADWRIVITLIAWSALIKGAVIVLFPQFYQDRLSKFLACKKSYHVSMIIVLLLGIFLAYEGF